MDVKIIETIDYESTAEVLLESYVSQWGIAGTPEWNPKYVEYLDKTYIKPNNGLCVGAFEGQQLVGVGFGFIHNWYVSEPALGVISVMGLCNLGVRPAFQRKGIATAIVKKLEEQAAAKNVKLSYRICNQDLNDHKVLKQLGYTMKMDNIYQFGRVMGKEMIDLTVKLREMGAGMKLLLKAVAGLPKGKDKLQAGIIREGNDADVEACVSILNSYKNMAGITRVWTEDEFKVLLSYKSLLIPPFEAFFYVWDMAGTIKGFVAGRFESIRYNKGTGLSAITIQNGFVQEVDRKDKTSFIVSFLYAVREKHPETFACNLALGHHEEKAFDKAGFNNDRSTRPLFVKLLTDELKDWLETAWKYKNYMIPYQR